jgi:hypothetical protein
MSEALEKIKYECGTGHKDIDVVNRIRSIGKDVPAKIK